MPVTDVTQDLERRTLTITAEFAAPVERIWAIYEDARQLERTWGPPTHPATFVTYDFEPGGVAHYFMTGPEGERYYGFWRITEIDAPRRFGFQDGFALDDTFAPNEDLPVSENAFAFEAIDGGTRVTFTSTYETVEALEQVLGMGMVEGATSAINQIDDLVAA